MLWLDVTLFAVIALSTFISMARGFAKDAISLSAWILAFVIAISLADKFAIIFPQTIENERIRIGMAFAILFLATLIMGMVANFLFSGLINMVKMQNADRGLGALFGFLRGAVIVAIMVVLGAFIGLNETSWWGDSKLIAITETGIEYVVPWLPDSVNKFIKV